MTTAIPRKVFLLGLGAQKAGTSWLADYLAGRDDTDVGFRKEYHVFDWAELAHFAKQREGLETRIGTVIARGIDAWQGDRNITRLAFMAEYRMYFAYFADLLRAEGVALTADITPSYSGLSPDTYRMIRDEFAARGIRVAPVFLMRDPVDRAYSALRMARRNHGRQTTLKQDMRVLRQIITSDGSKWRADYRRTIENIDAVWGGDSFIHFYEELFTESTLRAFCNWVGLPFVAADFDKRVNASEQQHQIPQDVRLELAASCRDSFDFLADRFGADRLARIWPSFAMINAA
jgi:hypothetical protein